MPSQAESLAENAVKQSRINLREHECINAVQYAHTGHTAGGLHLVIFLYFEECPPLVAVESRSPLVSIISHLWSVHDGIGHGVYFQKRAPNFFFLHPGFGMFSSAWSRRSFSNSGRVRVHKSKVSSIIWRGLDIRGNLNGDDSEACQKGMPQNAETKEPKRQFISDLLPMQVVLDLAELSSIPLPI